MIRPLVLLVQLRTVSWFSCHLKPNGYNVKTGVKLRIRKLTSFGKVTLITNSMKIGQCVNELMKIKW